MWGSVFRASYVVDRMYMQVSDGDNFNNVATGHCIIFYSSWSVRTAPLSPFSRLPQLTVPTTNDQTVVNSRFSSTIPGLYSLE